MSEQHFTEIKVPLSKRDEIFEKCFWPRSLVRIPTEDLANALVDLDYHERYEGHSEYTWNDRIRNEIFESWRRSKFVFDGWKLGIVRTGWADDWEQLQRLAQGISKLFPEETIYWHDLVPMRNPEEVACKIKDGAITSIDPQEWYDACNKDKENLYNIQ